MVAVICLDFRFTYEMLSKVLYYTKFPLFSAKATIWTLFNHKFVRFSKGLCIPLRPSWLCVSLCVFPVGARSPRLTLCHPCRRLVSFFVIPVVGKSHTMLLPSQREASLPVAISSFSHSSFPLLAVCLTHHPTLTLHELVNLRESPKLTLKGTMFRKICHNTLPWA